VCSGVSNQVLSYSGTSGAFLRVAATGQGLSGPVGLTFGPDGTMYVGGALSNRAYAFAPDGTFLRSFTCGTARNHVGCAVDHLGRLLVAQSVTNQVIAYDPNTGDCLGVAAQGNGLATPIYLTLEADGNLLVGSFGNSEVLRFDPTTAQFLGVVVPSSAGGLNGTHTAVHMPDAPVPVNATKWGALKVRYR
jgi:outer membrane protein assembly factor BamB